MVIWEAFGRNRSEHFESKQSSHRARPTSEISDFESNRLPRNLFEFNLGTKIRLHNIIKQFTVTDKGLLILYSGAVYFFPGLRLIQLKTQNCN